MIRLLIVDDEPYTVDGLYEMLDDVADLELDLYRAYAPEEAMEWLARTKMDIVLSDIRMPGMTGLELQRWIAGQWPRCKIIFLTGIRDLHTAQQAIRGGTADYILKTEGDEAILRSIRKAIDELSLESRSELFLQQAQNQVREALPLLHREWLASRLDPLGPGAPKQERMDELGIPLDAAGQLLPVVGRVDRWEEGCSGSDRTLMLYAVQNIAAELLAPAVCFSVHLDANHVLMLIQPPAAERGEGAGEPKKGSASFVQGTLESVQGMCDSLLKLPVSFVSSAYPLSWRTLPQAYTHMRRKLLLGLGTGVGMLLTVEPFDPGGTSGPPPIRTMTEKLDRLLADRMEEPFLSALREFLAMPDKYSDYAQAYYSAATVLLAGAESLTAVPGEEPALDVEELLGLSAHASREQADRCLLDAAVRLFGKLREQQDERTHQVIDRLHLYIHEHLGGDLSLTRLAEIANLNPTYLSVLYKQCTGHNLSEHIADLRLAKAKELLEKTPLKIHEIAERVGFGTAGYFNRFFKKRIHMTPQEFRSTL